MEEGGALLAFNSLPCTFIYQSKTFSKYALAELLLLLLIKNWFKMFSFYNYFKYLKCTVGIIVWLEIEVNCSFVLPVFLLLRQVENKENR